MNYGELRRCFGSHSALFSVFRRRRASFQATNTRKLRSGRVLQFENGLVRDCLQKNGMCGFRWEPRAVYLTGEQECRLSQAKEIGQSEEIQTDPLRLDPAMR